MAGGINCTRLGLEGQAGWQTGPSLRPNITFQTFAIYSQASFMSGQIYPANKQGIAGDIQTVRTAK